MQSPRKSSDDEILHICIHPGCGACGQFFWPGDKITACKIWYSHAVEMAVLNFAVTTLHCDQQYATYDASSFPKNGYPEQRCGSKLLFCMHPDCRRCQEAEESATIHTDCLNLFRERFKAYNDNAKTRGDRKDDEELYKRLWIAATRRYPWRRVAPLKLQSNATSVWPSREFMKKISDICGCKTVLLSELGSSIIGGSPSPPLRLLESFCSVFQLAEELYKVEAGEATIHPLYEVLSWARGKPPQLVQSDQLAGPLLRLTIDSRGIKTIKRISKSLGSPATEGSKIAAHSLAFIVEPVEKLQSVKIEFQFGMSRLIVPDLLDVNIWNTSDASVQANTAFIRPSIPSSPSHYNTISLNPSYSTGISFFIDGDLIGIHEHAEHQPSALYTFEFLNSFRPNKVVWIYVPLSIADRILKLGVRHKLSITHGRGIQSIRLQMKSGDIIIGDACVTPPPQEEVYMGTEQQHLTLVYEVPCSSRTISAIGADADCEVVDTQARDDRLTTPPFDAGYFSSASLENVKAVEIFTDTATVCKGIIVEYNNGMKRALGQCRLGLDTAKRWERPLTLWYKNSYQQAVRQDVYVTFDPPGGMCTGGEWEHHSMNGTICFWFTAQQGAVLRFYDPYGV